MYGTLAQFLSASNRFVDDARCHVDNRGPHIIVVDNFYSDPDSIRAGALAREFVQYAPPLPEHVGLEVANEEQFTRVRGRMLSTALYTFRGIPVSNPIHGYRFNPASLKSIFEDLIGEAIDPGSWDPGGDGWNGAFHLREYHSSSLGSVHHHFHATNTPVRGWSGVCYLSPVPAKGSGTSFWADVQTGKCVAGFGEKFRRDLGAFEKVYEVENVYNRLVLFRENVLHKIEDGFGEGLDARLTQTFFFHLKK